MRKIMIFASLPLASLMATAAIAGPEKSADKAATEQASPEAKPADTAKPAGAANDSAVVGKKVAEEWSKYDAGAKGHLTQAEFGKWMGDLRASAGQPAPDANWLGLAFTQTDSDSDKKISEEELKRFLVTGA
jgi:hypothetical protein